MVCACFSRVGGKLSGASVEKNCLSDLRRALESLKISRAFRPQH